ncbi:unnamed protein product [Rhizoctonia solani]|uniref:Uncharacterized protein n=1 Tax=Rhizoctonia solani TaxID=456999 RepID=A0A8H2X2Z7_9AGAM|nr:unnamed protein product [Rhizoctonia solani]
MVASHLSAAVLLSALISLAGAAPTETVSIDKRAQVLAAGTSPVGSNLPDYGLLFRASGYLAKGDCPASVGITTCYVARLSSKPNENLDKNIGGADAYTQSNFVTTGALEATGAITKFTFKYFIGPALKTPSPYEMKLIQVVSKEPVADGSLTKVWLDIRNNKAGIYAFDETNPVVSIPLSSFTGKTTVHTWIVKGGNAGYVDIDIKDAATGISILKHRENRPSTRDSYRFRIGAIRSVRENPYPYLTYFGDYTAQIM